MTRKEIADRIAQTSNLKRNEAMDIVGVVIEEIKLAMMRGEKVSFPGFGSFEARERKARVCRNPKTGGKVEIGARKIPFFKAGAFFKKSMTPQLTSK